MFKTREEFHPSKTCNLQAKGSEDYWLHLTLWPSVSRQLFLDRHLGWEPGETVLTSLKQMVKNGFSMSIKPCSWTDGVQFKLLTWAQLTAAQNYVSFDSLWNNVISRDGWMGKSSTFEKNSGRNCRGKHSPQFALHPISSSQRQMPPETTNIYGATRPSSLPAKAKRQSKHYCLWSEELFLEQEGQDLYCIQR